MNKQRAICILGGMGPQASARFLADIVDMSVREFGSRRNDDFPEIIVDSVPVPDFISDARNRKKALKMLKQRVEKLNVFSPSVFGIACNSAHIFIKDLKLVAKAEFISLIETVSKEVKRAGLKKVGLLATPTTVKSKLYERELERLGVDVILTDRVDLITLERIIRKILAGETLSKDLKSLVAVAKRLQIDGAQGIILGCTELPLIFPRNFGLPVFSSSEILARALLRSFFRRGVM